MWLDGGYVAPLRRIDGGARAKTHLAQLRLGTQIVTAYVKAFEAGRDRMLFNELAGALIARRAGIGAPPGGLVWVPSAVLTQLFPGTNFAQYQGMVPCYASAPIDNGYGLAVVGLADSTGMVVEAICKVLLAWPGFAACVVFDEWVANIDRHSNNVLIGRGGRLVPIDHSDCFGGPNQHDDDFSAPHAWFRNRLLEDHFVPDRLPLPSKTGIARAAESLPECFSNCAADLEKLRPWLGEPLGLHWSAWLQTRAEHTAQWMRERVRLLV